jgi:phage gp46-like protein
MTDVRIININTPWAVELDWLLTPIGRLDESDELATMAKVALGTDGLADVDDILPDIDSSDRRGWWGDLDAELIWGGWKIGSRLWLLARSKITPQEAEQGSTLARAEWYTREALVPFINKRICQHVTVAAWRTERERIEVRTTIYRGPQPAIALEYQALWAGIRN